MKNLILLVVLLASTMAFADGSSILYWMLDTESRPDYAFVQLREVGGDAVFFTDEKGSHLDDVAELSGDPGKDHFYSDFAGFGTGAAFILELMNEDGVTGRSAPVGYDILAGYLYDPSSAVAPAPYAGWQVSSVPEPTSGLLTLCGLALLALKRKRT